jgi:hypothetical protein
MTRINDEITLLRSAFPDAELEGQWVLIKNYPVPPEPRWSQPIISVCFQVLIGYPGTPPYGFYVPKGLKCNDTSPLRYTEVINTKPPFAGEWGFFSWQHDNSWFATDKVETGSNLLNFARSFRDRFLEGV